MGNRKGRFLTILRASWFWPKKHLALVRFLEQTALFWHLFFEKIGSAETKNTLFFKGKLATYLGTKTLLIIFFVRAFYIVLGKKEEKKGCFWHFLVFFGTFLHFFVIFWCFLALFFTFLSLFGVFGTFLHFLALFAFFDAILRSDLLFAFFWRLSTLLVESLLSGANPRLKPPFSDKV